MGSPTAGSFRLAWAVEESSSLDGAVLVVEAVGTSELGLILAGRASPVVLADILDVLGNVSADALLLDFELRLGAAKRDFGRSEAVAGLAISRRAVDMVLVDCVRVWLPSPEG